MVPAGTDVTCTIVNDDEPVDLEVTKADGGFTATAGEPEPFEYTITVQNLGPRELDDEPVTVVDTLPAAFRWVAPAPAGCVISGQTLTCDVEPASLRPVGETVTIVATAQVADGADAGIYQNRVTVTTEDDPVGEVPPCSNAAAVGANNNVDCEPTEVVDPPQEDADLAIVKTASVAQIGAGGGFDWTLDITNNGPGAAENVVIGDLVPSTLTVTGVASSDFDCDHTGNDVECTVGVLAVGASGTVTISVTVPSTATAGNVTNIGTVESDTPDPDPTNNSDDATVVIVAQAPPTPAPPPVTLPRTGSDATQQIARIAMMFLLLGGAVVLITRRRRDHGITMD